MADETNGTGTTPDPAAATDEQGAVFSLQKLYLKDVSFESPGAPAIFQEQGEQKLQLNLAQRVTTVGENLYEVLLTVTVTSKLGEKTLYLAEVQQAGVFAIAGLPEAQLQSTLGAYCPGILFPYARQFVGELVSHGGFPPLLLQPVNFDQLYADQVRKRQEQSDSVPAAS